MGKSENQIEQRLRTQVEAAGGLCWKFTSARAGVPDRIVVHNGTIVFVELKAPGGRLRPLQVVRHQELRDRGADVRTLSSIAEVDVFVSELNST